MVKKVQQIIINHVMRLYKRNKIQVISHTGLNRKQNRKENGQ